jgi:hypothetical protein
MAGYVHFEGLGWLDAFLNAAMLLGGPLGGQGLTLAPTLRGASFDPDGNPILVDQHV